MLFDHSTASGFAVGGLISSDVATARRENNDDCNECKDLFHKDRKVDEVEFQVNRTPR